jgi:DNA-binding response OmpR family regulator
MNKTILVVEDEEELRNNIVRILNLLGLKTLEASDGDEGIEKALNNKIDLIISDIKMPKRDGYEFLEELRKHQDKIGVPFIFLTSNTERSQIRKGMNIGADDYITKPFDTNELISSIRSRFEKSGKLDEFYKNKFDSVLNKYKKIIYNDLDTNLPNLNSFNKDIVNYKLKTGDVLYFFDLEVDGADEITKFFSKKSMVNLKKSIAANISKIIANDITLYHITDFEFIIILKTNKYEKSIDSYAIKMLELVKQPFISDEIEFNISASIGIYFLSDEIKDFDNIIKNARMARLYSQKNESGGYMIFNSLIQKEVNKQLSIDLKKYIDIKSKTDTDKMKILTEETYESKVYFLYPQTIIQDLLIKEIIKNEYEAYIVNDHIKMLNILKKYPNSVLFINIDAVLKDEEWQEYIRNMQLDPILKNVRIGVLSYNTDDKKVEKYIMQLMVSCGFIKLKTGFEECLNVILKALEAVEAKGKRKYIRIKCEKDVFCNIKINNKLYKGIVKDISTVGMAFYFQKEDETFLKANTQLDYIQINMRSAICFTSGVIATVRELNDNIFYVLMFDKKMKYDEKNKIYEFIQKALKEEIDRELAEL